MLKSGSTLDVRYEGDGIAVVTLNRPDRLNAVSPEMHHELQELFDAIDADIDTNVVVLTGAGRGFCSGGDTKTMAGRHAKKDEPLRVYSRGRHLISGMLSVEKPLIAMVNGPAAGLGATIALFCDVVFMSDAATIGDRHVNVGLVAGDGGAVAWPLLVGPLRAKELLMTGRMLSAAEAVELGLVNRQIAADALESETLSLAREIAAQPPYAVRATKAAINRYVSAVNSQVLDASLAWERISMRTEDHQEALRARAEKRPGVYQGI
ncbi:enoyl-CoA hydratase/isomerase family protein [Ruicaihuangia caeni]|uniref:Enoyl-CoA hydratase/isomerase family protein n=1 Tax=Ruicaihuangia caeni TaxID=3042517 RepID=A0AAW6TBK5_9MICO|nr:enoyl-CoA hydratase/isomerase family protein [Klugiella sp. YN-L-19]MDI2098700.1 enoyl-CoA hydratase/isomerase family protein [Klugiella sp. YN-L-19]